MLNRVIQAGLATFVAMAIAGHGVARAQGEEEDPAGDPADGTSAPEYDGDGTPDAADGAPADGTDDGMADTDGDGAVEGEGGGGEAHMHSLRAGGISVHVALQVGLLESNVGDPLSLSPDVWYGVSDKLAVGLTHSIYGLTGFWSGLTPSSLCIAGDACGDVYSNGGLQAKFGLSQSGGMSLSAIGGVIYNVADPFRLGLRAGVDGMWSSGQISVAFTPSLYIGLNERDTAGNKEALMLPVAFMFGLSEQLHLGAQTGLIGPLDGLGDSFRIPLAFGATFKLNHTMMVGGAFSLDRVAGGDDVFGATDLRSLALFFSWRN